MHTSRQAMNFVGGNHEWATENKLLDPKAGEDHANEAQIVHCRQVKLPEDPWPNK